MNNRFSDYKGSSRSTRDDSRPYGDRYGSREHERDGQRSRSRSRSPGRHSSSRSSHHSSRSRDLDYKARRRNSSSPEADSDDIPAPPPPPRISKISIGFTKPKAPIKMSLAGPAKVNPVVPKPTVASVFNTDEDDEPEEMPAEARMRMRNIGRETPTSAGPNSFGKTKQGFCDAKKVFEKNLKQALEKAEKPDISKLPQTIYKISGP